MSQKDRIVIVGGGLSGLTLAYLLSKNNISATVLEASDRVGGRIETIEGQNGTPLELGATWFSDLHQNLKELQRDLGLKHFVQYTQGKSFYQASADQAIQEFYMSEADGQSYRFKDGTQAIIEALYRELNIENIKQNHKVSSISQQKDHLLLTMIDGERIEADKVVLCFPPQVLSSIQFLPGLPDDLMAVSREVQTWMGGSIKFVLEYDAPFWRKKGFSGMLFSRVNIVSEMHDHTNFEENKFGFTGFLNPGAVSYSQEERKEFVIRQLIGQIGEEAGNPLTYHDKVWDGELVLGGNQAIGHPHLNNGHPLLQKSYMEGNLLFAGTEVATQFSGYMEGAVIAAINVFKRLK